MDRQAQGSKVAPEAGAGTLASTTHEVVGSTTQVTAQLPCPSGAPARSHMPSQSS